MAQSSKNVTFEEILARLKGFNPDQIEAARQSVAHLLAKAWLPQMGPQMDAFHSEAVQTLYGGAAGGGKTDLLLGLATTQHQRTVIFRRQSVDLATIWNRLTEIAKGRIVKSNSVEKKMRLNDGRFIEFGHLEKPNSEKGWQGNAHDLYGFDEVAQLDEAKVNFVIQWLRSTIAGQRARVVFATNPPIPEFDMQGRILDTGTGAWLKDWFAPWLEESFPDPAQPGELRWCCMKQEGDRLTTLWLPGPGAYHAGTIEPWPGEYTQDDIIQGRVTVALSRTFIKALLSDNAFYRNSGYAERLSGMPEPLRSLLLNGSFSVKGEDHPMQVIATMDVLDAQTRWRDYTNAGMHHNLQMLVEACDVAQGGMDTTVIEKLYDDDFFADPIAQPGRLTPNGESVEKLILEHRTDQAMIVLDGTGGWAGGAQSLLQRTHKITAQMCISSEGSTEWDATGRYKFGNVRTALWWGFREALKPKSGFKIKLPLSTRLMTQLLAPIYFIKGNTIWIESKDDLRKRLGTSTDEADAVIMAWYYREDALMEKLQFRPDIVQRLVHGKTEKVLREEAQLPADLDDPLNNWR